MDGIDGTEGSVRLGILSGDGARKRAAWLRRRRRRREELGFALRLLLGSVAGMAVVVLVAWALAQ